MNIRFTADADAELTEAREWYSHQHQDQTWSSWNASTTRCHASPQHMLFRSLRRVVVPRFPFVMMYELVDDEIVVIAGFHSRRNPEGWAARVR